MINLTDSIVIVKNGDELKRDISDAIQDTCKLIYNKLYPDLDYRFFNLNLISSNTRNPNYKLGFLKLFRDENIDYDDLWVQKVFEVIHNNGEKRLYKNGSKILNDIGATNIIETSQIAYQAVRGLHVFLIALWARGAVQLPISFSLPQTTTYLSGGHSGNFKSDVAFDLYPPILKLVRGPFQKDATVESTGVDDLDPYIPPSSRANYKSLAWRPIIASSWRQPSDISLDEVDKLFSYIGELRSQKLRNYPLSAMAWLGPFFEHPQIETSFTIAELRQSRKNLVPRNTVFLAKFNTEEFQEQRDSWHVWISNFSQMLYETGRIKNVSAINSNLADLSTYFLSMLPQHGITPPAPEMVTRDHIDGCGVAQSFRAVAKNQLAVHHASTFFVYVTEMQAARGIIFHNPITRFDKPVESKSGITNKKTFSFNEFREYYSLSYAILGFLNHVLYSMIEMSNETPWQQKLINLKSKDAILETADFGYVPVVSYIDIQGQRHSQPIFFLPLSLLSLESLPIRIGNLESRYMRLPTPDAIAAIITALETSIRFIHIRWLDRLRLLHDYPALQADFAEAPNIIDGETFNFFVNTDKDGSPWVRPTSTRLLRVFASVADYKTRIARDHFSVPMLYDHHDLTHYPEITALYCHNKDQTVLRENTYRQYYKHLIYFLNQLRISRGLAPLGKMPTGLTSFTDKKDFQNAYDRIHQFKTDYTPHGVRATVVSLSSTFLSDEHIGQCVSGHKEASVRRYCVINKQLVSDVAILNESRVISALSWSRSDAPPPPKTTHELLHNTFAIQRPNGEMLSNDEILARRHLLSTFPTHFCLAQGKCPKDVVESIGEYSCGQCYLGLKSAGHVPAILSYLRKMSHDLDSLKTHLSNVGHDAPDGVLAAVEKKYIKQVNEFSAWTLTVEHIIENKTQLDGNFLTLLDEEANFALIELPQDNAISSLLVRMSDAISYPELSDSSLKADIFKLSAKLMVRDGTFSSMFSHQSDSELYAEMRGRLEGILLLNNYSMEHVSKMISKDVELPQLRFH